MEIFRQTDRGSCGSQPIHCRIPFPTNRGRIMPSIDIGQGQADRIEPRQENRHKSGEVELTVSIGVAARDDYTTDLETLLARADQAMYIAKHRGRNQVAMSK